MSKKIIVTSFFTSNIENGKIGPNFSKSGDISLGHIFRTEFLRKFVDHSIERTYPVVYIYKLFKASNTVNTPSHGLEYTLKITKKNRRGFKRKF